jgi:23S rRNA pseudouridine1911/1915/1917 synthase
MNEDNEVIEFNDEFYEHYKFVVDPGQSLMRIDKFLTQKIESISRTKIQNAAEAGCILVNDIPRKSNYKVKPGDTIRVMLPHPPAPSEVLPEPMDLSIVYEDDDVIVINKPAGIVVHPGYNNYSGTLLNGLLYYFQNVLKVDQFPLLLHRIDKNTSGLLVVAKNEFAQQFISKQFFEHTVNRTYIAVVWGDIEDNEGEITGYLSRDSRDRRIMALSSNENNGKYSHTKYKVLERYGFATLIECKLFTGRTHQIRAHMKAIGHPLFNDEDYGGNSIIYMNSGGNFKQFISNAFKICPRQALHAKTLGFIYPITNDEIFFNSDLPLDLHLLIEKFRAYTTAYN